MADLGPASGTGEQLYYCPAPNVQSVVSQEIHSQNGFQSAITTGVPGGTSGPASGLNNLGPADYSNYVPPQATAPTLNAAATTTAAVYYNQNVPNPAGGCSAMSLFRIKNPA